MEPHTQSTTPSRRTRQTINRIVTHSSHPERGGADIQDSIPERKRQRHLQHRNARIVVIPLSSYAKDDDQDAQVNVTTTESAVASLTFTADGGDYLMIATAEPRANATNSSIFDAIQGGWRYLR
jgi:hypothetical protein